jgi:hypothetical protein
MKILSIIPIHIKLMNFQYFCSIIDYQKINTQRKLNVERYLGDFSMHLGADGDGQEHLVQKLFQFFVSETENKKMHYFI